MGGKNLINNYHIRKFVVLRRCNLSFWWQGHLKYFLENNRSCRKSGNCAIVGEGDGGSSGYIRHNDALRTRIDMLFSPKWRILVTQEICAMMYVFCGTSKIYRTDCIFWLMSKFAFSIGILVYVTVRIFFYLGPSQADYPFILSSLR